MKNNIFITLFMILFVMKHFFITYNYILIEILFLLGAIIIYYVSNKKQFEKEKKMPRVNGIVVQIVENEDYNEFFTHFVWNNITIEIRDNFTSSSNTFMPRIGDRITVYIDEESPYNSSINHQEKDYLIKILFYLFLAILYLGVKLMSKNMQLWN